MHPTLKANDLPTTSGSILPCINKKYEATSQRKTQLDRSLAEFVATSMQPFSLVEEACFQKFCGLLDPLYELPSRTTLKNVQMESRYVDMKAALQSILHTVENLAITTDLWTSVANESFVTVTCHFIDKEFLLRSAVLSTDQLNETTNHSAQNIADSVTIILKEWNIFENVAAVVTDNDKAMVKMCEIIEKPNMPCFAHTLNLVVKDCLRLENVQSIVAKCKKIVKFVKQSNITYAKFKNAQSDGPKTYSLKQDTPTRWNSTHAMLQRLLETKDGLNKVLLSTPKAPPPLTSEEINIINDLVNLLLPFDVATKKLVVQSL